MQTDAFDYSWARPNPTAMAGAGIKAVGRYLWRGGKGVTVAEIQADWAAGVGVWLGYEADNGNHLKGAAQGTIDGRDAAQLLAQLAPVVPADARVYFACDQQVRDDQVQTVIAYLNAARAQCPGASCYAQRSVVDTWERPAWQTVAWSNGVSANAVIYQSAINLTFNGSSVDDDWIAHPADAGILWPAGHTPLGGGTLDTGDEMNAADWATMTNLINSAVANGVKAQLNEYFANGEGNPNTGRVEQAETKALKDYFATGEGNPQTGRIVQADQTALKLGPSA